MASRNPIQVTSFVLIRFRNWFSQSFASLVDKIKVFIFFNLGGSKSSGNTAKPRRCTEETMSGLVHLHGYHLLFVCIIRTDVWTKTVCVKCKTCSDNSGFTSKPRARKIIVDPFIGKPRFFHSHFPVMDIP